MNNEIELNENELELLEFEIKTIGTKGGAYYITIDGNAYGYRPLSGTTEQVAKKFKMILKHSPGKALAWLKKNAKLVSGSKEKKVHEREFSDGEREELAGKRKALPDGSFPIVNVKDLENAIKAYGRSKDPGKAKKHIIKRAKQMGKEKILPEKWKMNEELPAERVPTFKEFLDKDEDKKLKKSDSKEDLEKEKDSDPDMGSKYTKTKKDD